MLTFYILLSVAVSFICSLLEAAILSVTPTYLSALKTKNPLLYQKVSYLKDDIEKPLASILTFNTVAHTIGAAGAGAEAQRIWGNEYLSLFSAILTFVILFFSEIIPKSIGARAWKNLLPVSYILLKPMIILSMPIVWISLRVSKLIKGGEQAVISREEIPAMAELGLHSGILQQAEYVRLKSILDFADVKLTSLLRPLDQVAGISSYLTIKDAVKEIKSNTFSRLLVYGVSKNDVKGYVMRKDILQSHIDEKNLLVKDLSHKILILPSSTGAQVLFNRLLAMKAHIAAVIDDDGQFIGIITLEDLIEKLMGTNIYDEFDQ